MKIWEGSWDRLKEGLRSPQLRKKMGIVKKKKRGGVMKAKKDVKRYNKVEEIME